jgi:hypothetical protein
VILETQVRALDTAIQALESDIASASSPSVNESFRKSWRAFTSRWQVQRDAWLGAGDITRKFGFSESTFEAYRLAHQKWLADYQRRITGPAATPPVAQAPVVSPSFFSTVFAGSGNTMLIAALIVGGLYFVYKQQEK